MMDSVLDGDAISNIAMFHSKTPEALKTKVLDNFVPMDGPVRVVVATTALGMGVNIPNVERVCHFGIPDTVEEYVQEIGRAGRDGRKSHGILYFKSYHLAHCVSVQTFQIRRYVHVLLTCIADPFSVIP